MVVSVYIMFRDISLFFGGHVNMRTCFRNVKSDRCTTLSNQYSLLCKLCFYAYICELSVERTIVKFYSLLFVLNETVMLFLDNTILYLLLSYVVSCYCVPSLKPFVTAKFMLTLLLK